MIERRTLTFPLTANSLDRYDSTRTRSSSLALFEIDCILGNFHGRNFKILSEKHIGKRRHENDEHKQIHRAFYEFPHLPARKNDRYDRRQQYHARNGQNVGFHQKITPDEQTNNNKVRKYKKATHSNPARKYPLSVASRDKNDDIFPPTGSVAAAHKRKNS